jgi:hypothetical protein
MTEYGLFSDEGCFEAQMYSMAEAETRRAEYIRDGEDPEDVTIKEMCPNHEGEANSDCAECWREYADD